MKGTDVGHCKEAADKVQKIQDEIATLVEEWHQTFDPAERARIAAQLHAVRAELPLAQLELDLCMGGKKSPLKATFSGKYTLETTDSYALGPFSGDIIIGCQFSGDRTQVAITNFPSIRTEEFSVESFGTDQVTVSMTGGGSGTFYSIPGEMSIPITLNFHHSNTTPLVFSDSSLTLRMDTGAQTSPSGKLHGTGSSMDAQGNITLYGVGVFVGGTLGGNDASIKLIGDMSPHP